MYGVEAAGEGLGKPVATQPSALCRHTWCTARQPNYLMQDENGQISRLTPSPPVSIIPGWSGTRLAEESGRASYVSITDQEALDAFHQLTRSGIIPALESSHALARIPPNWRQE